MELEKYPIKFSLGQFILLLGVEVVVLALVFLLGARFGGNLLRIPEPKQMAASAPYQALDPDSAAAVRPPPPRVANKLVDNSDPVPAAPEQEGASNVPVYQIGPNGETRQQEDQVAPQQQQQNVAVNKSLFTSGADKNTMIRFKSSGNSKFAVEVGQFYDETLASHEINKLKQKGLDAYIVIATDSGGASVFGVRMGSFEDRNLAEQLAAKISNEQGLELRVVRVD